ncbi:LppM family (lipo)protein [Ruania halotolerans]|uniref:LppM family (lipo)protein n=1 Tax=Ruania halotolerans TaxID=2897773 RepID=UPI001E41ABDC|nr:hypothetical protein [Ruania halotolerans]UFU06068.1 hypothetical protein LQF10_16820 [Ruania halotolerans]
MKYLLRLVVVLVSVSVLAGCFRIDGDLTIGETADGETVSGEVTIAVEREWALAQGEDPDAMFDGIEEDLAAAPDQGVTGERHDDGEYVGMTLTLAGTPVERIAAATSEALTITRSGDDIVLTGDLSQLVDITDAQGWQVDLAVTFPNGVTTHDGDLTGSTVTWHLDSGDPALHARGPAPGAARGVEVPWIPVIGVLVLLSGVAFGWFSWRKRRR